MPLRSGSGGLRKTRRFHHRAPLSLPDSEVVAEHVERLDHLQPITRADRKLRVPGPLDDITPHPGGDRGVHFPDIVAQEEPLRRGILRVPAGDSLVASALGLQAGVDGVEPVRDQGRQVRRLGVRTAEEQLLRRDGPGRVDHEPKPAVVPRAEPGRHVREQRRLELAGVVAPSPQIAL